MAAVIQQVLGFGLILGAAVYFGWRFWPKQVKNKDSGFEKFLQLVDTKDETPYEIRIGDKSYKYYASTKEPE